MKIFRIKSKLFAAVTTVLLLTAFIAGCSYTETQKSNGEISLFTWTEYMPQSVLNKFQQETGIKVNLVTFSAIADMYSKVKTSPAGTYDIVNVGSFYTERMANEGLLEKLDKDNIPNIKNISDAYMKLNSEFDKDNTYSVPYQAVVATLCYNKELYPKGIKTYEDLFSSDLENSIVMINDPRAIIGTINVMLGYDFNETDPTKLAKTKEKLMQLKPNIKVLDSDSPKAALINGECSVGLIYNAEIALAQEQNPNIQIVYPDQGQYFGMDSFGISKGSKNKEKAEKFLNFILRPDVSQMISEEFPYINPNAEAIKIMDDSYKKNIAKNVPKSAIEKGLMVKDIGKTVDIYNDIWTEFTK
ncbi:MAG: hypothetical protein ACFWUC_13725 [Oscillospiraceae bacterium]|jgi:spermidine/putrescine transport system permease protein